jgi:hypothetical protein
MHRHVRLALGLLAGILLVGPGCGDADAEAGDAAESCPRGSSGVGEEVMTRAVVTGQTELSASFRSLSCLGPPEVLTFRVSMTNHSCSVPGYELDFDRHVRLLTSDGVSLADGFVWEVLSADEHHPLGLLTAPATTADGRAVVDCDTTSLTLEVTGIDAPPGAALELTWEGAALDPVRPCP